MKHEDRELLNKICDELMSMSKEEFQKKVEEAKKSEWYPLIEEMAEAGFFTYPVESLKDE
jgi:hypothetical protein